MNLALYLCTHMMRILSFLILIFISGALPIAGQNQGDKPKKDKDTDNDVPPLMLYVQVGKVAYKGDSIPHIITPTLYKYPPMVFKSEDDRLRYNTLVRNVKRVLPLAKLIKQTLIETYDYMETLPDQAARNRHMNLVEKGIKEQYKPIMKKLSYSQGKLLIKLVDRECHDTSYSLIQAFFGSFKAAYYQFFAGIFGASLKKGYDAEGDDRFTERVVRMVESGQI